MSERESESTEQVSAAGAVDVIAAPEKRRRLPPRKLVALAGLIIGGLLIGGKLISRSQSQVRVEVSFGALQSVSTGLVVTLFEKQGSGRVERPELFAGEPLATLKRSYAAGGAPEKETLKAKLRSGRYVVFTELRVDDRRYVRWLDVQLDSGEPLLLDASTGDLQTPIGE